MNDNECCPKFDPETWDGKIFDWKNKKFIREKVVTLFHIPLNFGSVMKKTMEKIDSVDAICVDWMGLSDHISKWRMDVFVAVNKEIPNADNIIISGKFLSKVYEGPFKDTGKWCDDFKLYAKKQGFDIKKWFMWYTTCPKCAKKYGKNYVTIIGKIS